MDAASIETLYDHQFPRKSISKLSSLLSIMALQLTELTSDAEFPPLMDALYDGYSHPYNGFWKLFKGPSAEECTARFTKAHNADPTSHWIYVTDTTTGQVVGGTQWNIYESNPYTKPLPPFLATWWEEGTVMRKFSDTLLKRFMSGRPKRMNRPHLRETLPREYRCDD